MSIDLGLYLDKRKKEEKKRKVVLPYTPTTNPYDPIVSTVAATSYDYSSDSSSSPSDGGGSSCD